MGEGGPDEPFGFEPKPPIHRNQAMKEYRLAQQAIYEKTAALRKERLARQFKERA